MTVFNKKYNFIYVNPSTEDNFGETLKLLIEYLEDNHESKDPYLDEVLSHLRMAMIHYEGYQVDF